MVNIVGDIGRNDRLADFVHRVLKKLSVLGSVDRFGVGSEKPYAAFLEEAFFRKLHGDGKTDLTA